MTIKKIFLISILFSLSPFLFSQEWALVLAGGGGKGAYQVGVWNALAEYGIAQRISAISGTSVGGLNAALFASSDIDKINKIWTDSVSVKMTQGNLLISQQGLSELLETVPLENIKESNIQVYVTTVRKRLKFFKFIESKLLPSHYGSHAYYFNLNNDSVDTMKAKLLATSAFPVLCKPVWLEDEDGGHYYSDGGEEGVGGDNVPINAIIENHPEIKNIIVVYLSDKNHVARRIRVKDYDKVNIVELFPSIDIDGDSFFESLIDGTANFSESRIKLLIKKGYDDTISYFDLKKIYPVSDYWFKD